MAEMWRDEWLENKALEIKIQRKNRVFVNIARNDFRTAMERLVNVKGFNQISAITGIDIGNEIEVIYHLTHNGLVLSISSRVPKDKPLLPTIVDLIPGSALYEREVHDILGVSFEGNPDESPLVLPDNWPRDIYPLRQEWTPEKIKKRLEKK